MQTRSVRVVFGVLAALLALTMYAVTSQSPPHQWGPFSGQVIDAQTGKPIPGAVFVVLWMRTIPTPLHAGQQFYDARVGVADEAGHFEIPSRGRPLVLASLVDPPTLSCIAPGYEPYHGYGARDAPIGVKLRPLTAKEREPWRSWDPTLFGFPLGMSREFQKVINLKRQEMQLPSIDFYSGNIERVPR